MILELTARFGRRAIFIPGSNVLHWQPKVLSGRVVGTEVTLITGEPVTVTEHPNIVSTQYMLARGPDTTPALLEEIARNTRCGRA